MHARRCRCVRTCSRPTTSSTRRPITTATRTEATRMTRAELENALKRLRLFGCLARLDDLEAHGWLEQLVTIETDERTRRSLENRTRIAGLGRFKALSDFDWTW